MKVFVEEIVVKNRLLALDIVHALENSPRSRTSYDVEIKDEECLDVIARNDYPRCVTRITVRRFETV